MEAGPSWKHRTPGRLQRLPALSLGKDLGFLFFPSLQVDVEAELEASLGVCSDGFAPPRPTRVYVPRGFLATFRARLATSRAPGCPG